MRRAARRRARGGVLRRAIGSPKVYRFVEKCKLTDWSVAATATQGGIQTYKLNDLFNNPNYKGLFDLYKITKVKLLIVPQFDTASVADSNNGPVISNLPMLYVAPNRSPWAVAPPVLQDALNDDGCQIIRLEKPVSMTLNAPAPRLLDGAGTGMPIQTNTNTKLWLSTGGNGQIVDQSGIEYYGHRWFLDNSANTAGFSLQIFATYYFTMKELD